ncbi:hypothetical protein BKA69DRAFT_1123358 [Paraphysoderma sedebokerense]|nr:hypothetical protein BKA69DRAFT_1123358 [Paraphysoderma sedebokerense]
MIDDRTIIPKAQTSEFTGSDSIMQQLLSTLPDMVSIDYNIACALEYLRNGSVPARTSPCITSTAEPHVSELKAEDKKDAHESLITVKRKRVDSLEPENEVFNEVVESKRQRNDDGAMDTPSSPDVKSEIAVDLTGGEDSKMDVNPTSVATSASNVTQSTAQSSQQRIESPTPTVLPSSDVQSTVTELTSESAIEQSTSLSAPCPPVIASIRLEAIRKVQLDELYLRIKEYKCITMEERERLVERCQQELTTLQKEYRVCKKIVNRKNPKKGGKDSDDSGSESEEEETESRVKEEDANDENSGGNRTLRVRRKPSFNSYKPVKDQEVDDEEDASPPVILPNPRKPKSSTASTTTKKIQPKRDIGKNRKNSVSQNRSSDNSNNASPKKRSKSVRMGESDSSSASDNDNDNEMEVDIDSLSPQIKSASNSSAANRRTGRVKKPTAKVKSMSSKSISSVPSTDSALQSRIPLTAPNTKPKISKAPKAIRKKIIRKQAAAVVDLDASTEEDDDYLGPSSNSTVYIANRSILADNKGNGTSKPKTQSIDEEQEFDTDLLDETEPEDESDTDSLGGFGSGDAIIIENTKVKPFQVQGQGRGSQNRSPSFVEGYFQRRDSVNSVSSVNSAVCRK